MTRRDVIGANATAVRRGPRRAAIGIIIVMLLLAAMAGYILFVPVQSGDFESTTGMAWASFADSNSDAAAYLEREARLLAVALLGFCLLVVAVAWGSVGGDPRRLRALWLAPVVLGGIALVFITGDGAIVGATYAAAGAIVTILFVWAARIPGPR